jgi:hypothetical protein
VIAYLSAADIAPWFDVTAATVTKWRTRYPDFPAADAVTGRGTKGRPVHGWLPERESEIRAWKASLPGQGWRSRASQR